jgi:hypothetical protein
MQIRRSKLNLQPSQQQALYIVYIVYIINIYRDYRDLVYSLSKPFIYI